MEDAQEPLATMQSQEHVLHVAAAVGTTAAAVEHDYVDAEAVVAEAVAVAVAVEAIAAEEGDPGPEVNVVGYRDMYSRVAKVRFLDAGLGREDTYDGILP